MSLLYLYFGILADPCFLYFFFFMEYILALFPPSDEIERGEYFFTSLASTPNRRFPFFFPFLSLERPLASAFFSVDLYPKSYASRREFCFGLLFCILFDDDEFIFLFPPTLRHLFRPLFLNNRQSQI